MITHTQYTVLRKPSYHSWMFRRQIDEGESRENCSDAEDPVLLNYDELQSSSTLGSLTIKGPRFFPFATRSAKNQMKET